MIAVSVTQSLNDVKRSARSTQNYGTKRLTRCQYDHHGQNTANKNGFVHPTVTLKIVEIIVDEVHNECTQQISEDDVGYHGEIVVQNWKADEHDG